MKKLFQKLPYLLSVAAILLGGATYAALIEAPPFGAGKAALYLLINIDIAVLLLLGGLIARKLAYIWGERRRGAAGARLHANFVTAFSLATALPAIFMAILTSYVFNFGLQSWFSDRVRTAIEASQAVAQAYLEEHQQVIKSDAMAMAADLNREAYLLIGNKNRMDSVISTQAFLRNLPEVVVFDGTRNIWGQSAAASKLSPNIITQPMLEQAGEGEIVLIPGNENNNRVRALLKLDGYYDSYLLVGRPIEARVLAHVATTEGAAEAYHDLEQRRENLQLSVTLIFGLVMLLLMLVAIWAAMGYANRIIDPIGEIIRTAELVRAGDLSARVPHTNPRNELSRLARAFNRMTRQLQEQQAGLISANTQLDERRRFSEAVLSGVSAGVIGCDASGRIRLANQSAIQLVDETEEHILSSRLTTLFPEAEQMLGALSEKPETALDAQMRFLKPDGTERVFFVRGVAEHAGGEVSGIVVTFDDITDLLSAQRKAAWADVARRIAHEIKNPLTPIQLAAERLHRRYHKEITSDPAIFEACTATIIRQVGDIGRMVDEFSAFARMPQAVMKIEDLGDICFQPVFLQKQAHGSIHFDFRASAAHIKARCDARQITQALTNLLQNAVDAIDGREGENLSAGEVLIRLEEDGEMGRIIVCDNGRGLPIGDRERLMEPYVTTRQKGTGLGLAIVRKIMEDHRGQLILSDRTDGAAGAQVTLVFPKGAGEEETDG
ncbi:MAG TPA: two-component sensor histidine kinase [Rhodospirillaceae bacterium]|nr:MAG: hypothetical protein A2018_04200 [Alphaproteobacteria bacterium GWF2_58_20]HAU28722.1 two-component sensor histidine kinase [Rhodospirillaceae bacterium]